MIMGIFFKENHIDSFYIAFAQRKFIKKNRVILIDFSDLANVICVLSEI